MNLGLQDRVAFVAASSKGLGRAVAEELATEGAQLVLCARGEEALRHAERACVDRGARVHAVVADLSDPDSLAAAVASGAAALGDIEILVTNTGGPPAGSFESHDAAAFQAAIAQNFDSVVNLTRAVLPAMKRRRWGRILNITSIACKQPVDGLILSNSVRAAVTGFARTLANEVAVDGITVNNVLPGYTRTDRLQQLAERLGGDDGPKSALHAWEREIPMGRIGEPEEFAALVAFLASERASYITGSSIAVDGGWIRALQ